jgi:hypothetical protein
MSNCPFCGAVQVSDYPEFSCGTYLSQLTEGMAGQSDTCRDCQIAALKALLAQATEIVECIADNAVKEWGKDGEIVCRYCLKESCKSDCIVEEAKALLPKLQAIEGKQSAAARRNREESGGIKR